MITEDEAHSATLFKPEKQYAEHTYKTAQPKQGFTVTQRILKMIFKARAISPAVLAASIEKGRYVAPSQVTEAMLDKHVNTLRRIDNWGDEALKPTIHFADLIERHLTKFITTEARSQLARCVVFILPLPFCGAYSEAPNTIIIGSGFIDYLAAHLYWGAFAHSLPKELSDVRHPDYPKDSVRDLIPVVLTGLLYLHFKNGDPLPNYRALISEDLDEQVRHSLAGALTFILLHELGHLELGHHKEDHNKVRMVDLPFQVPEDLSMYKLQELEADSFARKAMVGDYQPIHTVWINTALGPHFLFETMLSTKNEDHPICINRLVHAQYSSQDLVDRTAYLEGLKRSAKQYQSIEANNETLSSKGKKALLERMTHDNSLSLLRELNIYVESNGIDLTLAMTQNMRGWETLIKPDTSD